MTPEDDREDERIWFDFFAFMKSGEYIGPERSGLTGKLPPFLPLDPDLRPAPSPIDFNERACTLAVRGHGVVVITEAGVRLLGEEELGRSSIIALGRLFS